MKIRVGHARPSPCRHRCQTCEWCRGWTRWHVFFIPLPPHQRIILLFYPAQELRPTSLHAHIIPYVPYLLCNSLGYSPIALSTPLCQILYLTCHRTRIVMQKILGRQNGGNRSASTVFVTSTSAGSGARDVVVRVRLHPTPVTWWYACDCTLPQRHHSPRATAPYPGAPGRGDDPRDCPRPGRGRRLIKSRAVAGD